MLGAFNADIQADSSQLIEFCNLNKLDFIDRSIFPSSSFTFISQAHGTTSWLDHYITTAAGWSLISNAFITDNVKCSDQFPLSINIECSNDLTYDYIFKMKHAHLPQWRTANDFYKIAYTINTNEKLSNISIPIKTLFCTDSLQSVIVLCIARILTYSIRALSLYLKYLAMSCQYLMLIRIYLFVQWQAGMSMLKNNTALLKMHYGGGNIIINQRMVLYVSQHEKPLIKV